MSLERGNKVVLNSNKIRFDISCVRDQGLTHSIFVLGSDKKLLSDDYMIFYNQPVSPEGAVKIINEQCYEIDFSVLPSHAERLAFTIHVPPNASENETLRSLGNINIFIDGYELSFNGDNLNAEKALIVLEFYKYQSEWKLSYTLQGFNEGLAKLVEYYGSVAGSDKKQQAEKYQSENFNVQKNEPSKEKGIVLSLSKQRIQKMENENISPIIINLAKQADSYLNKFNLQEHNADVVIIIDFSASMSSAFRDGRVQSISEQLVAAGALFDENQSIDVFMFDSRSIYLGELTPSNFKNKINEWEKKYGLGGGTEYSNPLRDVRDKFFNQSGKKMGFFDKKAKILSEVGNVRDKPVYCFFLTDGDASDKGKTTKLMKELSNFPIFFQFVGINTGGWSSFSYLKKLDDMTERLIDNADFFELKGGNINSEDLFEKMFTEYPNWLKEAKKIGILKK